MTMGRWRVERLRPNPIKQIRVISFSLTCLIKKNLMHITIILEQVSNTDFASTTIIALNSLFHEFDLPKRKIVIAGAALRVKRKKTLHFNNFSTQIWLFSLIYLENVSSDRLVRDTSFNFDLPFHFFFNRKKQKRFFPSREII